MRHIVAVSPDGNKIAMAIGPCIKEYPYIDNIKTCAAIMDTNSPSIIVLIKESEPVSWLAWRSYGSNQELFISSFPLVHPGKIFRVEFSDANMKVTSNPLPKYTNLMYMRWNKTGQILACSAFKGYEKFLGLYYNDSNEFIITDIPSSGNIVWKDDKSLYVVSDDCNNISTVSITDSNYQVVKSFTTSEKVYLAGILDNELAYRSRDKIYLGDKILYEADNEIGAVIVDYPNIAFQTKTKLGRKIIVISNKGNLINEKKVKEDSILVGFADDFIYLQEEQQYIKKYNIINDNAKVSLVFSVNDI
jgi:hypothetical protein